MGKLTAAKVRAITRTGLHGDGVITTQVSFTVRTLGTDFLRGVAGQGTIALSDGKQVNVQWEETTQGFTITGYSGGSTTPSPACPPNWGISPQRGHLVGGVPFSIHACACSEWPFGQGSLSCP